MRRFIFIHNPKTAGTAMAQVLGLKINHRVAFRRRIPPRAFTFCFVRNTWDRLVSWYFYHRAEGRRLYTTQSFDEWIRNGCPNDYAEIPPWAGSGPDFFGDQQIGPDGRATGFPSDPLRQLEYLTSPSGEIIVDFIGHFEHLQEDFDRVCDIIGMTRATIPRKNLGSHLKYTDYYTPATKGIVKDLYEDEIQFFRFEFEDCK